jgi:hypothetical protein
MNHYKYINWQVPVESLLSVIPISKFLNAQVRPIALDIQNKIFDLLKIDTDKCDTYKAMLVYFPPSSKIDIHADITSDIKISRCVILPLQNCDQVTMNWYEPTDPSKIFYYGKEDLWSPVPFLPYESAKIIEATICNTPFIGDIMTFHGLENKSDEIAIAISIRIMPWSLQTLQDCDTLPPLEGIEFK